MTERPNQVAGANAVGRVSFVEKSRVGEYHSSRVVQLLSLGVSTIISFLMKKCSHCGAQYEDDVVACPIDHTSLIEPLIDGHKIPSSLSVVSFLYFLLGFKCVLWLLGGIYVLMKLWASGASIKIPTLLFCLWQPFVIGFWICAGLRRFSRGWRVCALVVSWWMLITLGLALAHLIMGSWLPLNPLDQRLVADLPRNWLIIKFGIGLVLVVWQYLVLVRPDVKALYYHENSKADT